MHHIHSLLVISKCRSQGTTRSQWFRGFQKLPKKRLCTSPVLSFFGLGRALSSLLSQTAAPKRCVTTFWCFFCSQATDPVCTKEEQQPLCCIVATGIYPTFCIADACSAGSASGISKLHLWRLFSLDTLNEYLERDPAPSELTYRVPTRHR